MFVFVVKQIVFWLYDKKVIFIDEMINLLLKYRELFKGEYDLGIFVFVDEMCFVDGMVKYFYQVSDNYFVEVVYILDEDWVILCVFFQVGCKMNCKFCMMGK